jgi:hypothetical protein
VKLYELTGVKKYYEKSLLDMMIDIRDKLGCELWTGNFAQVLTKDDWDYVYKVWYSDSPYDAYVDWVLSHQKDPHVPKVKRKLVKLDSFNLRPDEGSFDVIKVLKIEKLRKPKTNRESELLTYLYGNFDLGRAITGMLNYDDRNDATVHIGGTAWRHLTGEELPKIEHKDFIAVGEVNLNVLFKHFPDAENFFYTLADFMQTIKDTNTGTDTHDDNVMIRDSDGKFVIIDPAYDYDLFNDMRNKFNAYKKISGKSKSGSNNTSPFKSASDLDRASNAIAF